MNVKFKASPAWLRVGSIICEIEDIRCEEGTGGEEDTLGLPLGLEDENS